MDSKGKSWLLRRKTRGKQKKADYRDDVSRVGNNFWRKVVAIDGVDKLID